MTDEELIRNLRNRCEWEAADTIEALLKTTRAQVEVAEKQAETIIRINARAEKLEKLVRDAFFEGFSEGRDGGWVWGDPSPAWKDSNAKKELK